MPVKLLEKIFGISVYLKAFQKLIAIKLLQASSEIMTDQIEALITLLKVIPVFRVFWAPNAKKASAAFGEIFALDSRAGRS